MNRVVIAILIASPIITASATAFACNTRQLEDDLRWCLAGRNGRGDIAGGAYAKDAHQLENGWNDCDQSSTANDNFGSCTAGQKIDTARAILGYRNLRILTPGAKRSGALTKPQTPK